MIREVKGKYLVAGSSRALDARLLFSGADLSIQDGTGKILAVAPLSEIKISSRLGNVPRILGFPDQSGFETQENGVIDEWLRAQGKPRSLLHLLEGKLRYALACAQCSRLFWYGGSFRMEFLHLPKLWPINCLTTSLTTHPNLAWSS